MSVEISVEISVEMFVDRPDRVDRAPAAAKGKWIVSSG
jgi:hypothetical protein